jgi:DNA-binding CsgD family transcriptional regulator
MKHLQIILIVINLIIGTGAIFYIYPLSKRYKLNYLKTLVFYLISLNLLVFLDFIYKYALSFIDFNSFYTFSVILLTVPIVALYLAEFGITFSLCRITSEFRDAALSRKILYSFIGWVTVFILITVWGIIEFFINKNAHRFYITHEIWIFSMLVIIFLILLSHLFYSKKISNSSKRRSMLAFGYIFLTAFLCFAFGQLDYYTIRATDEYYLDHIFLILLNLSPLAWIHFYFQRPDEITQLTIPNGQKLDSFIIRYNISAREKEIIELLLKGKTNKEIETELFISFNTVKNHIYTIFKKAGVNSRAQLINLIQRFDENS